MADAIIKRFEVTATDVKEGKYIHVPTSGKLIEVEEDPFITPNPGSVRIYLYVEMSEVDLADEDEGDVVTTYYVVPPYVMFSKTEKFYRGAFISRNEGPLFVYEADYTGEN